LRVAAILATQATHLNNSSKVTSTSTSINVRTSTSSTRDSFLSSSSSTVRTTSREEINISIRATRHPAFLPQEPTRTTKQRQRKEEVVHASTVGNKAIGRTIAQRKQLSNNQLPMPQSCRMQCSKEVTTLGSLVPSMER
jgi:ribosomal protein L31